jgi:MoxR-like ATPase
LKKWEQIPDFKSANDRWTITEELIDDILQVGTPTELAIDRELVRRVLFHLKAGKHVILVGPPGVGKTQLAFIDLLSMVDIRKV